MTEAVSSISHLHETILTGTNVNKGLLGGSRQEAHQTCAFGPARGCSTEDDTPGIDVSATMAGRTIWCICILVKSDML